MRLRVMAVLAILCFAFSSGLALAQDDVEWTTIALNYYSEGLHDAGEALDDCLNPDYRYMDRGDSYERQYRTANDGHVIVANNVALVASHTVDVFLQLEQLACLTMYNSRMLQLQIEVHLLLAGIDRAILDALSR